MTPPSVLRQRHLDWFAAASGDLNPLHVDAAFARRTSYGRTIAQGALGAVLALRAIDGATLRRTRTLCLRFAHPIRPDEQLHTSAAPTANGGLVATLETQGRVAVRVLVTADAEACLADLEPVEARGRDRPRGGAAPRGPPPTRRAKSWPPSRTRLTSMRSAPWPRGLVLATSPTR